MPKLAILPVKSFLFAWILSDFQEILSNMSASPQTSDVTENKPNFLNTVEQEIFANLLKFAKISCVRKFAVL